MDAGAWLTAVCAVLAAATGIYLTIHEARRRERRQVAGELDELTSELGDARDGHIACERYVYELRRVLADHGVDTPPPR